MSETLKTRSRMDAIQAPIVAVVGDWIRQTPGTISLGQGVVHYGPPREALDAHLKAAGDVVMPGVPPAKRLAGLVRAARFYAAWYPARWLSWSGWPKYAGLGRLAGHMRWVDRTASRLARQQFHLMVQHGPGLEKKQAQLFRCVDIGAELYAIAAVCVRSSAPTNTMSP